MGGEHLQKSSWCWWSDLKWKDNDFLCRKPVAVGVWSRGHHKFVHNKSRGMLLITPEVWKIKATDPLTCGGCRTEGCDPTAAASASPCWTNIKNVFLARCTGASTKVSCCLNAAYLGAVSNAKNLRLSRSRGGKAAWEMLQKFPLGTLVAANLTKFWPEKVICICLQCPKRLLVCLEIAGFGATSWNKWEQSGSVCWFSSGVSDPFVQNGVLEGFCTTWEHIWIDEAYCGA